MPHFGEIFKKECAMSSTTYVVHNENKDDFLSYISEDLPGCATKLWIPSPEGAIHYATSEEAEAVRAKYCSEKPEVKVMSCIDRGEYFEVAKLS